MKVQDALVLGLEVKLMHDLTNSQVIHNIDVAHM